MSEVATAPQLDTDQLVDRYIRLRDKRDALKKEQAAALKPFETALEQIEGVLLATLDALKQESMRSKSGTFYRSTQTSVKVTAWSQTLEYIRDNDAWELLEARVNKTAAAAILEETRAPIPGVEVSRIYSVNVRRPS